MQYVDFEGEELDEELPAIFSVPARTCRFDGLRRRCSKRRLELLTYGIDSPKEFERRLHCSDSNQVQRISRQ